MIQAALAIIAIATLGAFIFFILTSIFAIFVWMFNPKLSQKEIFEISSEYASKILFSILTLGLIAILIIMFVGFCVLLGTGIAGVGTEDPNFVKVTIISIVVGLSLIGLIWWPMHAYESSTPPLESLIGSKYD